MPKVIKNIFIIASLLLFLNTIDAATVKELSNQIDNQKDKIQQLDAEIEAQRQRVIQINNEAQTLSQAVNSLKASENILETGIVKTQSVINKSNLVIEKLDIESNEKTQIIDTQKEAIAEALRRQYQTESESLIEHFLTAKTFSEIWTDIETLEMINTKIRGRISDIEEEKNKLMEIKKEEETEKQVLLEEKQTLALQQESIIQAKREKDKLLTQTKNKESEYRKILSTKIAQKEAFEKELFLYESALKDVLSKNEIPTESALLSWPVDNVWLTQRFGKTSDSGRLYASGTHNGIDMGVSIGTRVNSVAAGTVKGIGNTDQYPGCYSYGKWTLIEHDNGLTSLYAHLSSIKVNPGDIVGRGELIGLSGNTGYSTGPHLHLTLFASSGVAIRQYTQSNGCKQASIPMLTKQGAYLDPMAYLPKL